MSTAFELYAFKTGEILVLKKAHPCGGRSWQVMRTGAEIMLTCQTCGRSMVMPRRQLEKAVKRIEKQGSE